MQESSAARTISMSVVSAEFDDEVSPLRRSFCNVPGMSEAEKVHRNLLCADWSGSNAALEETNAGRRHSLLTGDGEFAKSRRESVSGHDPLDLKMPEMDGFQVLRWIRTNPATQKIPVHFFLPRSFGGHCQKLREGATTSSSNLRHSRRSSKSFVRRRLPGIDSKNREALTRFSEPGSDVSPLKTRLEKSRSLIYAAMQASVVVIS